MRGRIKHKLREWRCRLFHKHIYRAVKEFDGIIVWDFGVWKGCPTCDLWREVNDYPNKSN